MKKTKTKKVSVFLTEKELEILQFFIDTEGFSNVPEAIHASIRGYYSKGFPAYVRKQLKRETKDKINEEDYCVDVLKGAVDETNQTCRIKTGGLTRVIPLGLVKES